jgi:hypothetical protein
MLLLLHTAHIHADRSKEVWRTACKMHKNQGNQMKVQGIDGREWMKRYQEFLQETRKQYNEDNDMMGNGTQGHQIELREQKYKQQLRNQ